VRHGVDSAKHRGSPFLKSQRAVSGDGPELCRRHGITTSVFLPVEAKFGWCWGERRPRGCGAWTIENRATEAHVAERQGTSER